jgi:hypothetical protein
MGKVLREIFVNSPARRAARLAIKGKSSHISYMTVLFRIRPKMVGQ